MFRSSRLMENLVLPVRKGGLGNQMFQVAAALVYAKETDRQVLLPLEFYNTHRSQSGSSYETTIFSGIPLRIEKAMDGNAIEMLKRNGFTQYPGEPGFDAWSPTKEIQGNIILHGYFQYYPALSAHEAMIRAFYKKNLEPFLAGLIPNGCRVGIHVRRGDYLKPPFSDVHISYGDEYYKKALAIFDNKDIEEYWIFSDDIAWCKEQSYFSDLPGVRFLDEPDEYKALALMTLCYGGFICAASTFSWWGAYLGAFTIRSACVAPREWMKGQRIDTLFPKEWILLET